MKFCPGPDTGGRRRATLFRRHRIAEVHQVPDQRLDPGNRTEVCRPHVSLGNFEIEFGFDREHKINEVERRQSVLAEIIVAANKATDRSFGEQRLHQRVNAFAHIRIAAIKHAEISPKYAACGTGFCDDIISLTERDSGITILRDAGIRSVTLMEKNRANCH
jgi:hypothetical protein